MNKQVIDLQLWQEGVQQLRDWINALHSTVSSDAGLTTEERKQLNAVSRSIEQLQKAGVAIPDDLRQVKLRLSAKDVQPVKVNGTESSQAELKAILEELKELTQSVRQTLNTLKRPTKAIGHHGPKKHYGVLLKELIDHGWVEADSEIKLQWLKHGEVFQGKIAADGTVLVSVAGGWKEYKSLSTAASDIAGRSLNGWEHWSLVGDSGERTSLKEVREKYLRAQL